MAKAVSRTENEGAKTASVSSCSRKLRIISQIMQNKSQITVMVLENFENTSMPPNDREPGVSFIVTSYNKASYLPVVLESVWHEVAAAQGQMILVDDGSTDGSLEICAAFAEAHPEVMFLYHENHGVFRTLNRVITAAEGEWVRFCDSDDPLIPGSTQRLIEAACTTGAPIAYGAAKPYGPLPLPEKLVVEPAVSRGKIGVHEDGAMYLLRRMGFTPSRAIYRRAPLMQAFPLPEHLVSCQDLALSLAPAIGAPIAWVDEPMCFYLEGVEHQLSANRVLMWHQITRIVQHYAGRLSPRHQRAALVKACHRASRFHRVRQKNLAALVRQVWLLSIIARAKLGLCNVPSMLDIIARSYEEELAPLLRGDRRVY
ncbi:MAG: glycosyltransferase family 2 protein [Dichotomicrobium sp.]